MKIAIVDLGIGNLRSVEQAFSHVYSGGEIIVTSDSKVIDQADKVVLPGQGAIGTWFEAMNERGLKSYINHALRNKPVLGICVGMQALFRYCEEDGGVEGLNLFAGSVRHFRHFHKSSTSRLKIPQMGWNQVQQANSHALWNNINNQAHFYFVHSYCANMDDHESNVICGTSNYGHEFISAVARDNVFAVQFHPEKSHRDGLQLLKNFSEWDGV